MEYSDHRLSYWFKTASVAVLFFAAAWSLFVGKQALDLGAALKVMHVQPAEFKVYLHDYLVRPGEGEGKSEPPKGDRVADAVPLSNPLSAKAEELSQADRLKRVFHLLKEFENNRSQIALSKVPARVAGVEKASFAEQQGFKVGDVIKSVAGVTTFSVWDFYKSLDDRNTESLEVLVLRGKKEIKLAVSNPSGPLVPNQYGVLFVIPKTVSYVSKLEISGLVDDFMNKLFAGVGEPYKNQYIESLDAVANSLATIRPKDEADLGMLEKISSASLLVWHHEQMSKNISEYEQRTREVVIEQDRVIARLVESIYGLLAALILFTIAAVARYRVLRHD